MERINVKHFKYKTLQGVRDSLKYSRKWLENKDPDRLDEYGVELCEEFLDELERRINDAS